MSSLMKPYGSSAIHTFCHGGPPCDPGVLSFLCSPLISSPGPERAERALLSVGLLWLTGVPIPACPLAHQPHEQRQYQLSSCKLQGCARQCDFPFHRRPSRQSEQGLTDSEAFL